MADGSCDVDAATVCGPVEVIPNQCPEDITADGTVNVLDLVDLLLVFGTACP